MNQPEPTSYVEQQVQARIAAARFKVQAAKKRADDLHAARQRGLARRHAQKLRNQAEARWRQEELDAEQAGQDTP
ncbi:hypothetical protein [Streptomyces chartreusis]